MHWQAEGAREAPNRSSQRHVRVGIVFASEIVLDILNRRAVRERPGDEAHVIFEGEAIRAFGQNGGRVLIQAERQVDRVDDATVRADVLDEADGGRAFAQNAEAPCLKRREVIDVALWQRQVLTRQCPQRRHRLRSN